MTAIHQSNGDWFSLNGLNSPFDWYKVAQASSVKDRAYKAGFRLHSLTLQGAQYVPANDVVLFLGLGEELPNATVHFDHGSEDLFSQTFELKSPGSAKLPVGSENPQSVTLKAVGSTGLFTGSFNYDSPVRKATFAGALVRSTAGGFSEGRGHFLLQLDTDPKGPLQSGQVVIQDVR